MVTLSAKEARESALKLQEDFLRAHSGNPDLDERDIQKVRSTIGYVEKFVRHNKGNHEKAFKHMVEALTWRKSFGVNDIKFDDIDESLWQSGMAMTHGFDASGQNVVILNIAMHRKDTKKAPMLRKWIAFCYETHQKVYPNNKMCMVFDMDGAGLSNMDMDLVRFVINCFKIYFPDLLQWLLVYNMPWILQAAWKIVQSWLSEGGAAKVKLVTSETIREYIPAHNLLTKFGGQDTWEYVYEVERESMLKQIREAEERKGAEPETSEEDTVDSTQEEALASRYGGDEEDAYSSLGGGNDQSLLKKGSATSQGFRRRQVTRLMSLQESPEKEPKERNGSLPVLGLNREFESTEPGVPVGDIILSPPNELVFAGKKDSDVFCTLTLKNVSDSSTAYKIKTTAPLRYKVRPNLSLIDPKSIAKVQVMLIQGSEIKTTQDKFLVQTHTFPDAQTVPQLSDLPMYWKALPSASVKEHRMRCRWVTDISTRPVISQRNSITKGRSSVTSRTAAVAAVGGGQGETSGQVTVTDDESLEEKVHRLVKTQANLTKSMTHLQRLNYGIFAVLVLLLISIIFF